MHGMRRERSGFFTILFLIFLCLSRLATQAQTLQVQPKQMRAGESATLTWDTAGADAFLVGYGKKITGKGSDTVKPTFSTDFTLVSQTSHGLKFATAHVSVKGAKGDDGYPSLKEFEDPIHGRYVGIDYPDFLDIVWATLQRLGYSVRGEFAPKRPYKTAYTDFIPRPDLVSTEKIRARRLAIAVDVYEPKDGEIDFGVRAKLEFQYRGEDEWRPDKENIQLAKDQAYKVVHSLESVK